MANKWRTRQMTDEERKADARRELYQMRATAVQLGRFRGNQANPKENNKERITKVASVRLGRGSGATAQPAGGSGGNSYNNYIGKGYVESNK